MIPVETDSEHGTQTFQLFDDRRPSDNIYGEQPYSSPTGDRIAVRHYSEAEMNGGLSVLDLKDGSLHPILTQEPCFPAFHAWGKHIYYQEEARDVLVLKRCHYQTLDKDEVLVLPKVDGQFSYGTVSPNERFYAVNVHGDDKSSLLLLIDLSNGNERVLTASSDQFFKHEQFSLDGRNRILIQANSADVSVINLGIVDVEKQDIDWLPVDAPPLKPIGRWPGGDRHTPRCTGHEAWIGQTERVFLSTGYDEGHGTNIWSAASTDTVPTTVCKTPHRFNHVSVSRCGNFWIADTPSEEGVPIYIGSFRSGVYSRLVYSRTRHDGKQWSHTHPYLTANNRWLIFTSNRSGRPQVYGTRIQESFLADLNQSGKQENLEDSC